jgi:hypothetical protein
VGWELFDASHAEQPPVVPARVALRFRLCPTFWPPLGPQKREPLLEHIRDRWTLHWSDSDCTAAIWRNDFGLELRVLHGEELVESRSSRYGEAPLLLIADEQKADLIERGWTEAAIRRGE